MSAQLAKILPNQMEMEQTAEPTSTVCTYYVLRRYDGEFKIIYMDEPSAKLWKAAGWEFRSHDSREEAQVSLDTWQTSPQAGASRTGSGYSA